MSKPIANAPPSPKTARRKSSSSPLSISTQTSTSSGMTNLSINQAAIPKSFPPSDSHPPLPSENDRNSTTASTRASSKRLAPSITAALRSRKISRRGRSELWRTSRFRSRKRWRANLASRRRSSRREGNSRISTSKIGSTRSCCSTAKEKSLIQLSKIQPSRSTASIKIHCFQRASILKIWSGSSNPSSSIRWVSTHCLSRSAERTWTSERPFGRFMRSCWNIAQMETSRPWLARLSGIKSRRWKWWKKKSRKGNKSSKITKKSIKKRMPKSSNSLNFFVKRTSTFKTIKMCWWRTTNRPSKHLTRKFHFVYGLKTRLTRFMEFIANYRSSIKNFMMIWWSRTTRPKL